LIGQGDNTADRSVHGASNEMASGGGVGTLNIALARARVHAEQVGRLVRQKSQTDGGAIKLTTSTATTASSYALYGRLRTC
jgi:hypothetical protein